MRTTVCVCKLSLTKKLKIRVPVCLSKHTINPVTERTRTMFKKTECLRINQEFAVITTALTDSEKKWAIWLHQH